MDAYLCCQCGEPETNEKRLSNCWFQDPKCQHRFCEEHDLQGRLRPSNDDEVQQLRVRLEMEQAKLEQLERRKDIRAQDIRVARETIVDGVRHQEMCVELEDVKAALADVIKESRNKGFSVTETAWSRTPPSGLLE
eukprot:4251291-Amphidinium_carterae.2